MNRRGFMQAALGAAASSIFAPVRALALDVTFVAVAWRHLLGLLAPTGGVNDAYFYFDTNTDPAYFAMWRNDRPGDVAAAGWPPPGELGYVGLFTLILVLGVGVALWLGWRRTTVLSLGLIAVGWAYLGTQAALAVAVAPFTVRHIRRAEFGRA